MPASGDLVLSVLFVSPERNVSKRGVPSGRGALAVHVKEARNLAGVKANGFSDPFCKCYLMPDWTKAGKQKTDTIKKDCNPRWDHTFVFQVRSKRRYAIDYHIDFTTLFSLFFYPAEMLFFL